MHTHTHTCIHIHIHINLIHLAHMTPCEITHIYIRAYHTHTYTHMYMYIITSSCAYHTLRVNAARHGRLAERISLIHTYIHTYKYTYIHIHTYTHAHFILRASHPWGITQLVTVGWPNFLLWYIHTYIHTYTHTHMLTSSCVCHTLGG
jgi:hypothetical protein